MKLKLYILLQLTILLTACGGNNLLSMDSNHVLGAASEIADFDLPAGYHPEFSVWLESYTVVSYKPDDEQSHLYVIQSQNPADTDKFSQDLIELYPAIYDSHAGLTILETRTITVRGQDAYLTISEGIHGDGGLYRQAVLVFEGKTGPALLAFSEPGVAWDTDCVEALLASIH